MGNTARPPSIFNRTVAKPKVFFNRETKKIFESR